ncbi:hypothetical protein K452DRAFT_239538, partial [Aplosporella prunicola CBS 121167]
KKAKTYNSWDSLVVTHLTTNQPVHSLCMAERTGCPVFYDLWSYVIIDMAFMVYVLKLLLPTLATCLQPDTFLHFSFQSVISGFLRSLASALR